MKNIVKESDKFALSEIEKFGFPEQMPYTISNEKGLELARKLNADETIVQVGTRLMDIKLGQAMKEGRTQDHIKMSVEAVKEFLGEFDVSDDFKKKIINCIEAHHGTMPFKCKEAEICANADCYRFLLPRGFFNFLMALGKMGLKLEEAMKLAESKVEEKYNILSLEICKKQLEGYYQQIKQFLNVVKGV